jgi:hypothetical protein
MLLDWGLDKAQEGKKGIYLFVDGNEVELYEDLQFEELEVVEVGGKERHLMVWEPRDDEEAGGFCSRGDDDEEEDGENELASLGLDENALHMEE